MLSTYTVTGMTCGHCVRHVTEEVRALPGVTRVDVTLGDGSMVVESDQAIDFADIEQAVEEAGDDPAFIAQALGVIARSGNVSELARRAGMSREGLYKALSAEGNPSFATIMKVAKALGLRIHFESVA